MTQRLTYNDMKNLKVGDLIRFQRNHGTCDTNPIDTVAVVTVPFGKVFDKQGNVAPVVQTSGYPVTSHNYHLFTIVSQ
jgi:hypothetical protein